MRESGVRSFFVNAPPTEVSVDILVLDMLGTRNLEYNLLN